MNDNPPQFKKRIEADIVMKEKMQCIKISENSKTRYLTRNSSQFDSYY